MKVVILAGGFGTRLAEETKIRPKPLVKIGGKPIIWHIIKIYNHYGIKEFVICLGYKGDLLKKELDKLNKKKIWDIKYVHTGKKTMTGGRIKRIKNYVNNDEYFCLSYGDGLSDVNINKLVKFHIKNNKIATLTAVRYKNPKGVLSINKKSFSERPVSNSGSCPLMIERAAFTVLLKWSCLKFPVKRATSNFSDSIKSLNG